LQSLVIHGLLALIAQLSKVKVRLAWYNFVFYEETGSFMKWAAFECLRQFVFIESESGEPGQ
jgi:hypothetical protein